MARARDQIDKPEPRWQAILAVLAVTGTAFARPAWLSLGPHWILPLLVLILLVPTIFAHRTGRHSLNHILGIIINVIMTASLIVSVVLLLAFLPSKKEAPAALLLSGAELWISNVLIFALWYWRLDGGGPTLRGKHDYGSRSFVFPQMQVEVSERPRFGIENWRPGFVDYLFIAFTTSSSFGPTDAPVLEPWAKLFMMLQACLALTITVVLIARAIGVL